MSSGPPATGWDSLPRLSRWLLLGLAAAAPAVFALATDNIWEDFFITYRSSVNLAQGNGLVYEVGRRLHTFTSPLGVLLPAGLGWLLGTDDPLRVMDLFRLCSCVALAGAWALAAPRLAGAVTVAVAAALWLLDPKLAAYATNGMETGLLAFFVILWWRTLLDGRIGLAGLALAGLMWTRPDGFVYAGAVAAGIWLFPGEAGRLSWRAWVRIGVIAAVIYTPWFVWAWSYYGSPVPNTIVAKGTHLSGSESVKLLLTYPFRYVFGHCVAHDAFLPPYFFFGGWPSWLWWLGKAIALGAAAVAAWPRCARPARVAGLAFFLGGAYLTVAARAPWYFPAWQVLAYIAVGGGASAVIDRWRGRPVLRRAFTVLLIAGGVAQAVMFAAVSTELREQQRLIEWGLRAPLGRDLARAAASPKDTVFLEPLGYIGYFSGLSMRDTPGLCAPEVIAIRKAGHVQQAAIIAELRPDWAVLRAGDFLGFSPAERSEFERHYRLWAQYDVREEVKAVSWFPGRDFAMFDAYFLVWRQRGAGEPARP
ncbi:MAG TPA: hypothetical protein VG734_18760 [Lacunisphaera sp.]|nr:hypothetical protein [Lacunisphaera sp.]